MYRCVDCSRKFKEPQYSAAYDEDVCPKCGSADFEDLDDETADANAWAEDDVVEDWDV